MIWDIRSALLLLLLLPSPLMVFIILVLLHLGQVKCGSEICQVYQSRTISDLVCGSCQREMPSPVADQHGTYESVGGVHQPLIRKAGWSGLWLGWLRGVEVVVDQGELAPVILPGRSFTLGWWIHHQTTAEKVASYTSNSPVDLPVARLISHGYPSAKIHLRLYK
ncbi:hypothetical protein BO99DRAFT_408273 [Aspergillus violaceofuscus CBS 115571]|uniref:Uncharacterized protein n=1 Tax=Aspergillus violaceofuscus (strain CBS 115571) TaxID=1450538 RepID=A0A2V5I8K2_ASPV1|nr:hypothetical protein BO99DRAFT_408273 [Aspergillus violaceofuscus CBS 115571]